MDIRHRYYFPTFPHNCRRLLENMDIRHRYYFPTISPHYFFSGLFYTVSFCPFSITSLRRWTCASITLWSVVNWLLWHRCNNCLYSLIVNWGPFSAIDVKIFWNDTPEIMSYQRYKWKGRIEINYDNFFCVWPSVPKQRTVTGSVLYFWNSYTLNLKCIHRQKAGQLYPYPWCTFWQYGKCVIVFC